MCGIAGRINFSNTYVKQSDLKCMSDAIAHRGPNDEGFYISPNRKIGLVNRRLAIIDLSKKGHMPMSYKGNVITYNGEVYNFRSEREKLQKKGYRFRTKTDTEVILALYDKYGINALKHLRGMFAFAIYDPKKKLIFIARDRIGKKPLKYYLDSNVFIFASELKAILTQKEVKRSPDFLAIHHYLTFGYVPSPQTGFQGIKKLPPGHFMLFDLKTKKLTIKKYWQPDFSQKLQLTENEWCKLILSELEEATKLRMVSDVPLGAFLSGGVDSSGVVATMARLSKKPINTFSISFKEKRYDETIYAARVAKIYRTNHHFLTAKVDDVDQVLPKLVYQYEEPYADSSAVATYAVSNLAKKYVTVVLNGDGGDENFAGYDRHKKIKRDVFLSRYLPIIRPFSPVISQLSKRLSRFLDKSKMPLSHRYASYNSWLKDIDKINIYSKYFSRLTRDSNSNDMVEKEFKRSYVKDKRDKGLYFDLTSYLPHDLLVKVDIASMANSLEGRSPLLDHKIIELASKIPYGLKVKNGETKYIFKKALEKIVPKVNLYRPKKGFSVPLDEWFEGKLNKYAYSKLIGKKTKTKDFFRQQEIKRMLNSHSLENDFGMELWPLLTLELWMQQFFN